MGLFHESLANEESLPRYNGQLFAARPDAVVGSRRTSPIGALLAAGLAASLLTWLSYAGGYRGAGGSLDRTHQAVSAVPEAEGFISLCALQLPKPCLARDERQVTPILVAEVATKPLVNVEDWDFSCCTQCHQSGGTGPASARAFRAFNVACTACHRPAGTSTAIDLRLRWPPLVKGVG